MVTDTDASELKLERRKIQLSGRTTYVVSLPKAWVQAARLEAGDSVAIDAQDDGSLSIIPENVRRTRSDPLKIAVDGMGGDALLREMMAGYLAGYDLIEMSGTRALTQPQREAVRRMTAMTVGLEVVEESARGATLQDMVDPTQFASRGGLQRLQRIVTSMVRDALSALETHDMDMARDVIGRDDSVDRMYLMIAKQHVHLLSDISMARRKQVTLKESLFLAQAARSLERCGDHATRIAYTILEATQDGTSFKEETWGRVKRLAEDALALLQRSVEAFMRADKEAAHKVLDESEALTSQRGPLTRSLLDAGEHELLVLGLVVESLERIHQYAADIAEGALAHALVTSHTGPAKAKRVPRAA